MDSSILKMMAILRIILSFFVLYITNISVPYKILLIILIDSLDCNRFLIFFNLYKNKKFCKTKEYQITDKIVDTICSTIILFYIIQNKLLDDNELCVIIGLYLYRLIGVIYFIRTGNRKFLFYLPQNATRSRLEA